MEDIEDVETQPDIRRIVESALHEALQRATVELVLYGAEVWPFEAILLQTYSNMALERQLALNLMENCKGTDIESFYYRACTVIRNGETVIIRRSNIVMLYREIIAMEREIFYRLDVQIRTFLRETLFASVLEETDDIVFLHVCELVALVTSIVPYNGFCHDWPQKLKQFILQHVYESSPSLCARLFKLFSEWAWLTRLSFSRDLNYEAGEHFYQLIINHVRVWNKNLSIPDVRAAISSIPHLKREGRSDTVIEIHAGIVELLSQALSDERKKIIEAVLDVMVGFAETNPELFMNRSLFTCVVRICSECNVEEEIMSASTEFLLSLVAETSVREAIMEEVPSLVQVLYHMLKDMEDESDGGSNNYEVAHQALVRIGSIFGEDPMFVDAYNRHFPSLFSNEWLDRHATIVALAAIVEGCLEVAPMSLANLRKSTESALKSLNDPHPRVKLAAMRFILKLLHTDEGLLREFWQRLLGRIDELLNHEHPGVQELAATVHEDMLGLF